MSLRLAAAGLLPLLLLAPAVAPSVSSAQGERAPSHCANGEITVYECNYGRRVLSVCERYARVHYRYGPLGAPEISLSSTGQDGGAFQAEATGTGGGYQVQMRFHRGQHDYIVFAGEQNPTDTGPIRNGVAVVRNGRTLSTLVCPDTSRGQVFDAPSSMAVDGTSQEMVRWR